MIQAIAQMIVMAIGFGAGFGFGWIYRDNGNSWEPEQEGEFFDSWEEFQQHRRDKELSKLTIIEWEREYKDVRVN